MEKRKLERVQYWQGQTLRSADFNDIHGVEEQRRWWHNRALHNAYGIHLDPDTPSFSCFFNSDRSAVTVNSGLAYDSFGRELILETDQTIALPTVSSSDQVFVLLVRYRTTALGRNDLSSVCYTNSAPLKPEFVELAWKLKDNFAFTDGVPLVELQTQNNELVLVPYPLSSPRPLARPLLATGSTVPGNTAWEFWESSNGPAYGVQTTIDTSASGFTDAPCYFAWLQGPLINHQTQQIAPALFTSIAEEAVDSFVFRLVLPPPQVVLEAFPEDTSSSPSLSQVTAGEFSLFARRQNLYVSWIGCQENASAPPFFKLQFSPIFSLGLSLDFNLLQSAVFGLNKITGGK